jgi:anti-sigma regulatory factor (Ser/Thr protein kinase)
MSGSERACCGQGKSRERDRHCSPDGLAVATAFRNRASLKCRSRSSTVREDFVPVMCEQAAAPTVRWAIQSVLAIAALPTAVPCARLHARNVACEWGLDDLADTVELVVSELVTNAVQASVDHDGRPRYSPEQGLACIHLRLSTDEIAALVEVWDENFRLPAPTRAGLDDESGRGLMLVNALAERWGWDLPPSGRGKIVWALVER